MLQLEVERVKANLMLNASVKAPTKIRPGEVPLGKKGFKKA